MNEDFSCQDFLAHHGILGQRWGVRRYQNEDGSLTEEGRKRYGSGKSEGIKKHIDKKIKEHKKEKAKQQQVSEEERAARQKEELKEHLRKHPKQLPKYSRQLTREDAEEIISNINFDRKLKDVRRDEIQRGMRTIDDVSRNIGTLSNLVQNGKNLWNNTADVVNALADVGVLSADVHLQKVGVGSDMDIRRQTLFKMSPEDVLKNKDKYTTDELKAYSKRKGTEKDIYDYTKDGQKEKESDSGGKDKKSSSSAKDVIQQFKDALSDEGIELPKAANDIADDIIDRNDHHGSSGQKQKSDQSSQTQKQPQKQQSNDKSSKNTSQYIDLAPTSKESYFDSHFTKDEKDTIKGLRRSSMPADDSEKDFWDNLYNKDYELYNKYKQYVKDNKG